MPDGEKDQGQETGKMPVLPLDATASPLQITQRHLPHWHKEGVTYFVTFRLADSIPQDKLRLWRDERDAWLRTHPEPRTPEQEHEFRNIFSDRILAWLDQGYGECWLKNPAVSEIVENALLYFDGDRYVIGDFVIMPNHVHLIVTPTPGHDLSDILHSWKSFTSKQINKAVGRTGTLWQDESYNHIVRSDAQLAHYQQYIRENPVKAHLRPGTYRSRTGVPPVSETADQCERRRA
ncbi:transposase [Candidatus Sumerlaeota bacterium]|nr:transposase [Candidatus Sumerlaeota bacterium]